MKRFTLLFTACCLSFFAFTPNAFSQSRNAQIDAEIMTFMISLMQDTRPQWQSINERIKDVSSWISDEKIQRAQVAMEPVDLQLGIIIDDHVTDAQRALKEARRLAELTNCNSGLSRIKIMQSKLDQIESFYRKAKHFLQSFTTQPATSNLKSHLRSFQENYNNALQTSLSLEEDILGYHNNPCMTQEVQGQSAHVPSPSVPSHSSSQTQTQTQTQTSTPSPAFTGPYTGNNLLLLFGRKLDDPAIQHLLSDASFGFKELTTRPKPGEKTYYASAHRMGLKFKDGMLVRMSFSHSLTYNPENHFKEALPLGIPFTKSSAGMKSLSDTWSFYNIGGADQWNLKKYGLSFSVKGNPTKKIVDLVEIEAKDVKDWNGYYGQFED